MPDVEVLPSPPPGDPCAEVAVHHGEVVAAVAPRVFVDVHASYYHDVVVVAVAVEELLGVGEEVGVGDGVILEYDAFFLLREEPLESGGGAGAAAEVFVGVEGVDLGGGVVGEFVYHLAHSGKALWVGGVAGAWPVLEEVETRGRLLHGYGENLPCEIGTVEVDDEYGSGEHRVLFLFCKAKVGEFDAAESGDDGVGECGRFAVDVGDEAFVFLHEYVALEFERGGEEAVGGRPFVGDESEVFDLLVGGEVAVDGVDDCFVFLFGFGHGEEGVVVAVVHVVFQSPVVEGVEVGRDDDAHAFLVFAYDHGLVDVFGFAEFVFEQLGGDVFACREFEDVFFAVGNAQIALAAGEAADKFADVAGVEPSVGVDDLGCVFGVFVVAEHDVRSASEDFAVFGNLHFNAAENGSHGSNADIAVGGVVDGNDGRGFGEAIAFVDVHAGGGKGADDAGLDAGGAGDDGEAFAAQAFAPVAVDEALVEEL